MEAQPRGPYVQAALFCDKLLQEADGTISAIRIIDRITHTVAGPDAPEDLPPFNYQLTALVMLKAGDARGRQNFVFSLIGPDGIKKEIGGGSLHFEGGEASGVNIPMNLTVTFTQEGVYWFEFASNGQILARMPLAVRYARVTPGGAPPQ